MTIYVILNNKIVSKGKSARVCFWLGYSTKQSILDNDIAIVLRGDDEYDQLRNACEVLHEHVDAGITQCEYGSSLGFTTKDKELTKHLKLY